MSPIRAVRMLGNSLGLAWWARIETQDPAATYWIGPFIRKSSLKKKLSVFVSDLSSEGANSINYSCSRGHRAEPLTS